ncbi:MAG: TraB/GumN family protein [Sphingomonas bacterium]|nr:TraB/GumN family protein [Sphingomonas bacterium]
MVRAVFYGRVAPTKRWFRKRALIALGLSAALIAPGAARPALPVDALIAATPGDATPALWEVRDGDTTIYLFGTFHTLDESIWFDRSVRAAFDRSGELVLETIAPTDPAQVRAIGHAIAGPRPAANNFLAATRTAVERGRAAGLSVDRGADSVLRRAAADQGMILFGIELFADQLRTFARISDAPAPPAPAAAPSHATAPITLAALLSAWKLGNTGAFSAMLAGFEAKAPAAYRLLIADRNVLYGEWIAHRLGQPGTVFVAVGAGHLAGKDSVQNWLSAKGIQARRIA